MVTLEMTFWMGCIFGVYLMLIVYQEIREGKDPSQRHTTNMWNNQNQNPGLMLSQLCNTDYETCLD